MYEVVNWSAMAAVYSGIQAKGWDSEGKESAWEQKISGIFPATNSGAPYLAFFARCGKFTAFSRQFLEISMNP
jgi:hypothetical protein